MDYEAKQPVYFPVTDFLALEFYLMDTRPGMKPEAFVTNLVKRWLTRDMERLALAANGPPLRGFQWKSVLLPDGTILRTSHGDTVEFAKVTGDRIVANDGITVTPSLFANRYMKGRNAWRFVWLSFPGETRWVRADSCRGVPRRHAAKTI